MEINMIMSGLALLAATASLFLSIREKKRNEKRNAAMIDYIAAECKAVKRAAYEYADNAAAVVGKKVEEVSNMVEEIGSDVMNASGKFQDQLGQTLASIMSFDPVDAHRKAKKKEQYGWEAE